MRKFLVLCAFALAAPALAGEVKLAEGNRLKSLVQPEMEKGCEAYSASPWEEARPFCPDFESIIQLYLPDTKHVMGADKSILLMAQGCRAFYASAIRSHNVLCNYEKEARGFQADPPAASADQRALELHAQELNRKAAALHGKYQKLLKAVHGMLEVSRHDHLTSDFAKGLGHFENVGKPWLFEEAMDCGKTVRSRVPYAIARGAAGKTASYMKQAYEAFDRRLEKIEKMAAEGKANFGKASAAAAAAAASMGGLSGQPADPAPAKSDADPPNPVKDPWSLRYLANEYGEVLKTLGGLLGPILGKGISGAVAVNKGEFKEIVSYLCSLAGLKSRIICEIGNASVFELVKLQEYSNVRTGGYLRFVKRELEKAPSPLPDAAKLSKDYCEFRRAKQKENAAKRKQLDEDDLDAGIVPPQK